MLSSLLNRLRLSPKLTIAFLLVGVIPFVIIGLIALNKAQTALSQQAFNQIESVKAIKSEQIKRFFEERRGDINVLGETISTLREYVFNRLRVVREARIAALNLYFDSLKQNLKNLSGNQNTSEALKQFKAINGEDKKKAEKQFGSYFSNFAKDIKAQDLILISAEGDIIYSVQKAGDLGLNINDPKLRGSGLSQAFKASQANSPALGDMAIYPFGGKPLFFAVEALKDGEGKFLGALALAFSPESLNQIMEVRTGLGRTGETYLVGPDYLMRSDSFLDKSNRSVFSSLLKPAVGKVETLAARNALNGQAKVEILKDYNGNAVLSSYAPFNIWGTKWALIAEIDVAEAFVPLGQDGKEFYKKYTDTYGYYDLFLFSPEGDAFYTVAKEADYKTNFVNGKYSDSNLGKLFREVVKSKKYGLADFAPYAPSNGEPAAFIALPIIGANGNIDVVAGLQLSLTAINDIMQKRDGLGKTGETYLVGQDYLMRSDSFLDPLNHSVKASFTNPLKGKVETKAAKAALDGKSASEIIIDYNGNPVLSSYAPINLEGTNWALIAEIDEAEAFAAISALKIAMLVIGLVGVLAIVGVALLVARSLANPIMAMTGAMRELSHGNLKITIPARDRQDELGDMSQALQIFKDNTEEKIRLEALAQAQEQAQKEADEKQRRREALAIEEMAKVTLAASQGDMNARIRLDDKEGFFRDIAQGVNGMAEVTGNALNDVSKVLKAVAGGDLSQRIASNYQGIFAELKQATNQTANKLREIVDSINAATNEIASAASQVAAGSTDLSERSEEQASSLEETAASMEEIAATVKQNSGNAQTAKELAKHTENTASGGDVVVSQAIAAMDKILESSKKIEDIVGMIDEIAFQTNLLALNAAVEAARAGDAGKGFAVVAQEVRNLAQRSALASKDIKLLISASGREVANGAELVKDSGQTLSQIASGIKQLTNIVNEIAAAGQEQASGIEQINQAISQMDEMTQRNAALVEESTAAARSLEEQAKYLKNLMSFFK